MATLEINGMDDLNAAFGRIGSWPDSVKRDALGAMASIAMREIKRTGESMGVRDPDSDVHILDNLALAKAKLSTSGGTQDVTFRGTRTRGDTKTRNAEIAFINEYGTRDQPARPFIGRTMAQNDEQIADAGGDVLLDWIETEYSK